MIQGIESLVDSRKLKEHYGLMMGAPFNPRLYDIDTAYFHPLYGCLMTDDHVEWFASKVSSTVMTLSSGLGANPIYLQGQEAANGQHFAIGGCSKFPN